MIICVSNIYYFNGGTKEAVWSTEKKDHYAKSCNHILCPTPILKFQYMANVIIFKT